MSVKSFRGLLLIPLALGLSGCNAVLLNPAGEVAVKQRDLMIASVILMLLIIVPVLVAIAVVAWRYRASNPRSNYDAHWEHSATVELVVWGAPLLIIIALGAMTWIGTHQLDPYRSLNNRDYAHAVAADAKPLRVEVVSLDWKWLFLYPDYGIATVNEMAAPLNVPIDFRLTSTDMMNSFFVPALAGQIYTMPRMQTVLHAVINKPGDYKGFSANFSGHGFTDMRFRFLGRRAADFERWVAKIKAGGGDLDRRAFEKLAEPSRAEPVRYYARYTADLFDRIVDGCMDPQQPCMRSMMAADVSARSAAH